MLDSLVSGGYWAQAPQGLGGWLAEEKCNVVFECGSEKWDVVWMGKRSGFSGGWRGFAIDQRLAPGDALTFKKEDGMRLRVGIFRRCTAQSVTHSLTLTAL